MNDAKRAALRGRTVRSGREDRAAAAADAAEGAPPPDGGAHATQTGASGPKDRPEEDAPAEARLRFPRLRRAAGPDPPERRPGGLPALPAAGRAEGERRRAPQGLLGRVP